MNTTVCPSPPFSGLLVNGPSYIIALLCSILYPVFLLLSLSIFLWKKNTSVYLRKRSLKLLTIQLIGICMLWFAGSIIDVVGPAQFPCVIIPFLLYFGFPFVSFAEMMRLANYSSEVGNKRLLFGMTPSHSTRRNDEQTSAFSHSTPKSSLVDSTGNKQDSRNFMDQPVESNTPAKSSKHVSLEDSQRHSSRRFPFAAIEREDSQATGMEEPRLKVGKYCIGSPVISYKLTSISKDLSSSVSCATFQAHIRVVFLGSRKHEDRILNSKFAQSWGHTLFYLTTCLLPFMLAFLIRLGLEPLYHSGCYGCEILPIDCICLDVICIINFIIGLVSIPYRLDWKNDPLQIKREAFLINLTTLPCLLPGVLLIIDPGNLNQNGIFSWRILLNITVFLHTFFILIYPVYISRKMSRYLVLSENFNREDRFNDVMKNKNLKNELRIFLTKELSIEIILFIDAVDRYRKVFLTNSSTMEKKKELAEDIFVRFIKKNSKYEVNLMFKVRDTATKAMENSNIQLEIFDQAYDEVKNAFLKDGFTRFLDRAKKLNNENTTTIVTADTSTV